MLQGKVKPGEDPEVLFESYEWDDDLEDQDYQPRDFEKVSRRKGQIVVTVSR
jgi:hypothetical protein